MSDIRGFKGEHDLAPAMGDGEEGAAVLDQEEPDLRAEDDALVAAALEAEEDDPDVEDEDSGGDEAEDDDGAEEPRQQRRRGRRGGRRRRGRGRRKDLEGTFDHGDEGYGLWLDPAVQEDPVYAEHWAGHRPVTVTIEAERIVITRAGEETGGEAEEDE